MVREDDIRYSFGVVIEQLKEGKRAAREGWNGKGMYIFLVDEIEFHTKADVSDLVELSNNGEGLDGGRAIAMKTVTGSVQVGWLASQADMLAEDWIIYD